MIELAFLAGVAVSAALATLTVAILMKLDLLRNHTREAEQAAKLDAHILWAKEHSEDARAAVLNLTAHVEKLHRTVNDETGAYHGEEIPSGMEVVGATEGMGQDG